MKNKIPDNALFYMRLAIKESKKKMGLTNPNPSVGTIIVKNNTIISKATTGVGGRPHSEALALKKAGVMAKNSDVYVTLEPCSHFGVTPPCANRLVDAGVKRVFVATKDPNPAVNGKGIRILRKNGIQVFINVMQKEAVEVNEWFFKTFYSDYPYVVIKSAMTLDGKIATKTGQSQWISSAQSLKFVHQLRQTFDAIMVGTNTILNDNPSLNVRLPKVKHTPDKVILDRSGQLNEKLHIFKTFSNERIFYFHRKKRSVPFKNKNILSFSVGTVHNKLNLQEVLLILKTYNVFSLLVEGGGALNASFFENNLVDKVIFIIAPKVIGGTQAISVIGGQGVPNLNDAFLLKDVSLIPSGTDYIYTGFLKRYF